MSRMVVEDLVVSRGGNEVLRGVSLDVARGEIVTLLGPSGSGKTTLLWAMAGLLETEGGRVAYEEASVGQAVPAGPNSDEIRSRDGRHSRPYEKARPRGEMGFVFQDGGLWEHLTVEGHLALVLKGKGLSRDAARERVGRVMEETGLGALAKRRPGEMSGGERQRLALARAVVVEPEWLFLDEPTSQLDGAAQGEMVEVLERVLGRSRGGTGVVMATHQVDLAMRLSGRVAVMVGGRITQVGTVREVYGQPANLEVARLMGEASVWGGRVVRPGEVEFVSDPAGGERVRACRFVGSGWHVETGGGVVCCSARAVEVGTAGRIRGINVAG